MSGKITSEQAIALENKYGAHNYHPLPVVLSKGEGVYVWDVEGKKYYEYYQERDWKLSRGLPIKDWKLTARNFVEKGRELERQRTMPNSGYVSNLHTTKKKDYGQPL